MRPSVISCGSARPLLSSSTKSGLDKTRGTRYEYSCRACCEHKSNTQQTSQHLLLYNMFFDIVQLSSRASWKIPLFIRRKCSGLLCFHNEQPREHKNKPAGKDNMLPCCLDTTSRRPEPTTLTDMQTLTPHTLSCVKKYLYLYSHTRDEII